MLRALLISPDDGLRKAFLERTNRSGGLLVLREFNRYPDLEELAGAIRVHDPQVIAVDVATDATAVAVCGHIQTEYPGLMAVALHHHSEPRVLVDLLHAGIREFLAKPFASQEYAATIERLRISASSVHHQHAATNAVCAFLPAKPGAGASTLAINTALALSRQDDHKALLVDFDLSHGVTRFQLKIDNPFSVQDAIERASQMEENLWSDLTGSRGRLDVLASAPLDPRFEPHTSLLKPLFHFMRHHYHTLVLDCSGGLDAFSLEVLAQCRRIILVTKPDMTTVHLGREKLRLLESLELADRVDLAVTGWKKDQALGLADIEGVLGVAAEYLIPDDPKAAYQGVLSGSGADPVSPLGKACSAMAKSVAHRTSEIQPIAARKRMIEYFSVLPARYSLTPTER